jgi:methyltransferase
MELSVFAFLVILAAVGLTRLAELRISRRHQRELAGRGVQKRTDPRYRWMVALHATVLVGAGIEVVLLRRPFIPALAAAMTVLVALAMALRWWVIRTLGAHWNVEVMNSTSLGIVTEGPFRWIRHPNYLGVFVELVALPLIHTAWITAIVAALGNAWILRNRLRLEESVLHADPEYRSTMAGKPRFLPRLF